MPPNCGLLEYEIKSWKDGMWSQFKDIYIRSWVGNCSTKTRKRINFRILKTKVFVIPSESPTKLLYLALLGCKTTENRGFSFTDAKLQNRPIISSTAMCFFYKVVLFFFTKESLLNEMIMQTNDCNCSHFQIVFSKCTLWE